MHKISAFLFFHEARRGQRGQVAAFLIIAMVIILVAATALIQIGKTSQRRLATANAADAAALAGASTLASSANMVSFTNNDVIAKVLFGTLVPMVINWAFPVDFRKEDSYFKTYLITSFFNLVTYLSLLVAGRDAITQSMAAAHQYAFSNVGIEEAPIRKKSDPYAPLKQPFSDWMEKPKNCSGERKESFQDDDCFMYRWTEHTFVPQEGTEDGGVHEADPEYSSWAKSEVDMGAETLALKPLTALPLVNRYRYYYIPCCPEIPYVGQAMCSICNTFHQNELYGPVDPSGTLPTGLWWKLVGHDAIARWLFGIGMAVAAGMSDFSELSTILGTLYAVLGGPLVYYWLTMPFNCEVGCEKILDFCGLTGIDFGNPQEVKDAADKIKACPEKLQALFGGIGGGQLSAVEQQQEACLQKLKFWVPSPEIEGGIWKTCVGDMYDLMKKDNDYLGCLDGLMGPDVNIGSAINCIINWKKEKFLDRLDPPLPYMEVWVAYVVPLPFIIGISNIDELFVESTVTRHSPEKNLSLWNMEVPDVSSTARAKVDTACDTACAQRGWLRIMPCYDLELKKTE